MFSQSSIDSMSVTDLVRKIRTIANEVENRINDPQDAYDYSNALILLSENLRDRIDEVLED